jgi:hypothetical protein
MGRVEEGHGLGRSKSQVALSRVPGSGVFVGWTYRRRAKMWMLVDVDVDADADGGRGGSTIPSRGPTGRDMVLLYYHGG